MSARIESITALWSHLPDIDLIVYVTGSKPSFASKFTPSKYYQQCNRVSQRMSLRIYIFTILQYGIRPVVFVVIYLRRLDQIYAPPSANFLFLPLYCHPFLLIGNHINSFIPTSPFHSHTIHFTRLWSSMSCR